MRLRCALIAGLLICGNGQAAAQSVVTSPAPTAASVTVYRDPDRSSGPIDPLWPNGYALISEQRTISLPAGESVIRFEGVADGMIAVSAVVTGLPGGVVQKNRDARLLTPAALLDGSLGNRVHLRRTNRQTGKVSEQDAIVRSGPDNAVVLQTAAGIEALRCDGLPETLVYDKVPDGLSAKPTLSVTTRSAAAVTAQVTLTYLASGFDWGASYVAKVAEDGKTLDLSAWLTLANGNGASFADAQLLAVAGRPNKQSDFDVLVAEAPSPTLNLKCWPMDSTSTHPGVGILPPPPVLYEVAMSAPMAMRMAAAGALGSQKAIARQEELGDLKLYRVPMRVDINPNGQKQVALLEMTSVPFMRFYGMTIAPDGDDEESRPLFIKLRMQNKEKEGLGLPLPSGGVVVMQQQGRAEMLLADTRLHDYAVGEKVELDAGHSDQVRIVQESLDNGRMEGRYQLTLTNALDHAVPVEITLARVDGYDLVKSTAKLTPKDGGRLWAVKLPANGKATLEYSLHEQ
ncbi:MAG: hypothetical protein ABI395_07845 [Sphingobium sp.]